MSTSPSEDQYVASTSDEDVVYTCTVRPLGNATAIWELNGTQLNTEALRQHVEDLGIYIYNESASKLTINFTQQARTKIRRVQCVGSVDGTNSEKGKIFHVRSFGKLNHLSFSLSLSLSLSLSPPPLPDPPPCTMCDPKLYSKLH